MRLSYGLVACATLGACSSGSALSSDRLPDGGSTDAAVHAAARVEAGTRDAGSLDSATADARGAPAEGGFMDGGPVDTGRADVGDGDLPSGYACPTSGTGAIAPSFRCAAFTPVQAGAAPTGVNADAANYALTPAAASNGKLVLYFNGSGGTPAKEVADPTLNFYTAGASLGYAVLAVSYRSDKEIASLCGYDAAIDDACYFPTRETLILGVDQPGASPLVNDVIFSEGIADRTLLALEWLDQHDPGRGWGSFLRANVDAGLPPEQRIAWDKIVVAGWSQGGGHAAACGKLFPVARVVQLSSTCDQVLLAPATWTRGEAGVWRSDPTQFWGLDTPSVIVDGKPTSGDTTCPTHAAAWESFGMLIAHQDDHAMTCKPDGSALGDTHGLSIGCTDNYPHWQTMLRPDGGT